MRFVILRKADWETENGVPPSERLLADMLQYHEALVRAGVMLAGEGLQPTSRGIRIRFSGGRPHVVDGPFAHAKELIAGFTMIQVKSREEAIEWGKRWPASDGHGEVELELRQVFEPADFGYTSAPDLRQSKEHERARVTPR